MRFAWLILTHVYKFKLNKTKYFPADQADSCRSEIYYSARIREIRGNINSNDLHIPIIAEYLI